MDNPEKLATQVTQDTERRRIYVNLKVYPNKRQRIPKGQSKMDNPENLATYGTQDEEKHNTLVLDTTMRKLRK